MIPNPFSAISRTTITSPQQRALDYIYLSVDEDQDGIPDAIPPVINLLKTPAISSSVISSVNQPKNLDVVVDEKQPVTHEETSRCLLKSNDVPILQTSIFQPVTVISNDVPSVTEVSELLDGKTLENESLLNDQQIIPNDIDSSSADVSQLLVSISKSEETEISTQISEFELDKIFQEVNEALPLRL